MPKHVYDFAEGSKDMKDLLGGKGANLAEMTNLGLPVPPGFVITTEACTEYLQNGDVPPSLAAEVGEHLEALEKAMLAFMTHQADVLLATTIVENGLDIPNANTIIINRADRYGLAQLYQLRGRVGRSDRAAYAFLLIPPEEALSPVARKRLTAIKEFSDLGSGFRVAALDLEIRGAGELLGERRGRHVVGDCGRREQCASATEQRERTGGPPAGVGEGCQRRVLVHLLAEECGRLEKELEKVSRTAKAAADDAAKAAKGGRK